MRVGGEMDGIAVGKTFRRSLYFKRIRLAGRKQEYCGCQSEDGEVVSVYTRYCELMLWLDTTRRMVSANMSATEICFTFVQRAV